ncbi:serine hydrolase [Marinitenerispora sediminis]|uniref:Serine hydrolase n=2 Tax=Marinitenerispora sediminis TaxID=1931232 RepID=A0A368T7X6_9ACTN|nr:serine hydrolase [Marinitenerispora sediminis]RCV57631.1 serine hydrolase [Marinitenerispora sediminis]RCV59928.1 serine hydrolase [Marinitenerispora sediminis]
MPFRGDPRACARWPAGTRLSGAVLAAAFLLAAAAPPAHARTGERQADLPAAVDAAVAEYRAATGLPGAAVAVTHGTEAVHLAGYGSTPSGAAVTERTPMAVASVSKSFTALAVLQLVDEGRVDLDAPVRDHLPEFEMADPRAADITVRQLLDQTSGMSDTTFGAFSRPQPASLREAVAGMRSAGLAAAPGERWEYHNPNFQVAARLVEVVSGASFSDYLDAHVFDPLGMADSSTNDTDQDLPPSAYGHVTLLGRPVAAPEPPAFGNGSGGVVSSARDMAAWLIAQHGGGRGADGTRILSADAVRESHTPSPGADSYGLGWQVGATPSGAALVHHGGDLFTSTAYQALLPESGHGVAVMANTGMAAGDASAIAEAVIAVIEGRETPPPGQSPLVVGADAVLLGLAVAAVPLAGLGVRRSVRWGARRVDAPSHGTVLRLLPLAVPVVLFAGIHRVVGFLYRGRDVAWIQVAYLYPAFLLLLGLAALGCTAVAVARAAALVRARRAAAR